MGHLDGTPSDQACAGIVLGLLNALQCGQVQGSHRYAAYGARGSGRLCTLSAVEVKVCPSASAALRCALMLKLYWLVKILFCQVFALLFFEFIVNSTLRLSWFHKIPMQFGSQPLVRGLLKHSPECNWVKTRDEEIF